MDRFPEEIRQGMSANGAMATCVPVQLDAQGDAQGDASWEAAVFFLVGGAESKEDRRVLRKAEKALTIWVEADLIEHAAAAVVVIRLEVHTRPDDPLAAEILLTPGSATSQFKTCKLLTEQPRVMCFFADEAGWVIQTQQITLLPEHRKVFGEILDDATAHDALIRMTARYDAMAALSEIVSHYEIREGTDRSEYASNAPENSPSSREN